MVVMSVAIGAVRFGCCWGLCIWFGFVLCSEVLYGLVYGPSGLPLLCSPFGSFLWWDSFFGWPEKRRERSLLLSQIGHVATSDGNSLPLRHHPSSFGINKKMSISCILSRCPTHLLGLAPRTHDHRRAKRTACAWSSLFTIPASSRSGRASHLRGGPIVTRRRVSRLFVAFVEFPCSASGISEQRRTQRAHLLRCGSEPEVTRSVGHPVRPIEKTGGRAKAREPPACPCPADLSADWSFWFILPISSCHIHPSLGIEPEPAPDFYRLTFLLTARRRFALCEEARLVDIPADINFTSNSKKKGRPRNSRHTCRV